MILASQNVQIAEEKDFVREKISGIFFVKTCQKIPKASAFGIFLSKPQAWHIIAARSAAYIISPFGAVSHHAPACILPAA